MKDNILKALTSAYPWQVFLYAGIMIVAFCLTEGVFGIQVNDEYRGAGLWIGSGSALIGLGLKTYRTVKEGNEKA